jgi:hypothetical protein
MRRGVPVEQGYAALALAAVGEYGFARLGHIDRGVSVRIRKPERTVPAMRYRRHRRMMRAGRLSLKAGEMQVKYTIV